MKVFIIGTGNVALALGKAFSAAGHSITGVFGRSEKKVMSLSKKFNCKGVTEPEKIPLLSDVYIVAISDDAIEKIAEVLPSVKGVVAHTAGAASIMLLKKFSNYGIFYPVETITKNHRGNFKNIPICIEASGEATLKKLMQLANSISEEVYSINSDQRAILHVAAVLTNNFTNAMLGIGSARKAD